MKAERFEAFAFEARGAAAVDPSSAAPRVDVHQHVWTGRLVDALAARSDMPRIRRRSGVVSLELQGEAPYELPTAADPSSRVAALSGDGVDTALVALSPVLGVESLPADEARLLIEAWEQDARDLPRGLGSWASLALEGAEPGDVDRALDRGAAGLILPASALSSPAELDRIGPVLERVASRGRPVLVHPGPPPADAWAPAITSYVAGLQAAWCTWALHGRTVFRGLRIGFAALAGLAPLHAERIRARLPGAPLTTALADPSIFYETSSYGADAVRAVTRVVSARQLVHGSDRPYASPWLPSGRRLRALHASTNRYLGVA